MTAFFLKAQHSSPTLPASLPSGWATERSCFLSHCAIWPPSPRRTWRTGPQDLLALQGGREPLSLCPWNWLAAQLAGAPWLTPESPGSGRLLGILIGLTLNTKHRALLFLPGAQSASGRGCCLSQCNPNLSVDVCNIYCLGLEKNGKKLPLVSQ